jgi:RHS repeat-associated protein
LRRLHFKCRLIVRKEFPGQYYDAETGLHYNGARFYDPQSGRYLQPDPLGQAAGLNIYPYASGEFYFFPSLRVGFLIIMLYINNGFV